MAEIRRYPFVRHLRANPSACVVRYRSGTPVARGPGLAFWFRSLSAAAVEVPIDDRELQFLFHGRSSDFQDIAVQGAVTYRVSEPETLAARLDFTIDLESGRHVGTPLEQLAGLLTQTAQGHVWATSRRRRSRRSSPRASRRSRAGSRPASRATAGSRISACRSCR
jgi:hypothetical protein